MASLERMHHMTAVMHKGGDQLRRLQVVASRLLIVRLLCCREISEQDSM